MVSGQIEGVSRWRKRFMSKWNSCSPKNTPSELQREIYLIPRPSLYRIENRIPPPFPVTSPRSRS